MKQRRDRDDSVYVGLMELKDELSITVLRREDNYLFRRGITTRSRLSSKYFLL